MGSCLADDALRSLANCGWRSTTTGPLGNERFYETIERMAGQRREARPRGRPRLGGNIANKYVKGQGDLGAVGQVSSLAKPGPFNPGPGELKSLALHNRKNGRSLRWRLHSTYTAIVW